MIIIDIFIIGLMLLLEGFFSGVETALISCNRVRIRYKMEKGGAIAKIIWALIENPHRILSTTLVGTNLCVVTSSIFATHLFISLFGARGPLVAVLVMTPIILIFGEMLPKSISRMHADKIIFFAGPILMFIQRVIFPFVILIESLSGMIIRGVGIKDMKRSPLLTREGIEMIVRQITSEGVLDSSESGAIHRIFDFRYTRVGEIMVRLKNLITVDYNDTKEVIIEKARRYGFTRYPVVENKKVKGLVNIFDLFYNEGDWHNFIRPISEVYSNQRINQVLYQMQRNKELMSAVVRKGKFVGIVTFEDIINEIELV